MNSKKTSIALTIITIINIVLLIYGFVTELLGPNSFNESLDITVNNMVFVIITFLLQLLNLIIIKVGEKKKIFIVVAIAIIIITIFIPVKITKHVKYKESTNRDKHYNSIEEKWLNDTSSTAYIYKYRNIYGITLKTDKETHAGMDIY